MSFSLTVADHAAGLAEMVAADLLAVLAAAQADGREPQIGLTGGSVADVVHREIARQTPGSGVEWSRVRVWFGDERFVAPDSEDRNALQARRSLLDPVGATLVHEMPSTESAPDVEAAAASYSQTLRRYRAGELDVLMLGLGPDGHVASLFPGFPQLDVTDRVAVGVTGSPKPPPERISLTFPALNRSRRVWFLVSGEGKAPAVAAALGADPGASLGWLGSGPGASSRTNGPDDGPDDSPWARGATVHNLPALGVEGRLQTTWYLDSPAASLL